MSPNIVAIAGVPPVDEMSGKLIGMGCPCMAGMGADEPTTEAQATSLRWVAVGLIGVAALGLIWMQRRHA